MRKISEILFICKWTPVHLWPFWENLQNLIVKIWNELWGWKEVGEVLWQIYLTQAPKCLLRQSIPSSGLCKSWYPCWFFLLRFGRRKKYQELCQLGSRSLFAWAVRLQCSLAKVRVASSALIQYDGFRWNIRQMKLGWGCVLSKIQWMKQVELWKPAKGPMRPCSTDRL